MTHLGREQRMRQRRINQQREIRALLSIDRSRDDGEIVCCRISGDCAFFAAEGKPPKPPGARQA